MTEGPRFADHATVLQAIFQSAVAGQVDASLVCGDLCGIAVPHVATVEERALLAGFFQALAHLGPVVIVKGNHDDADDIQLYRRLSGQHPIVVSVQPDIFHLETNHGGLDVFTVPWLTTATLGHALVAGSAAPGVEMVRGEAIRLFQQYVRQWVASVPRQGDPRVLAGHVAIGGAKLAGGEVLLGHDIELPAALLSGLDVDGVFLGHIHMEQQVADRVFYCGSPSPHSFGEPDPKGWNLVRIEGDELHVARVPSPAPQVYTIEATWGPADGVHDSVWTVANDYAHIPPGAEIRVRALIPDTLVGVADIDGLRSLIGAWKPSRLVIERKVVVHERVRSVAMTAATTIRDQARVTLDTLEPPISDAQKDRVLVLVDDVVSACGFAN